MKRLCEGYILHAKLIGAFYCWIPALAWFGWMMLVFPFREVYLIRLVLALLLGGCVAAWINDYGVRLWLVKHRSKEGPATIGDGFLMGAGVGIGITFLPPLTSLISTHHPEQAKLFIIVSWSAGVVLGGLIGSLLASIGRKYLDAADAARAESQK
jgi:MFS family permease